MRSISALSNSLPRSVWNTAMSDIGNSRVAKAALTSSASLLLPAACVADDLPVVEVDDQADVAPRSARAHVGEVAADVRARRAAAELAGHQVRRLRLVRLAGVDLEPLPPVRAREAVLPHDPRDPPSARRYAASPERRLDLSRSVPAPAFRVGGEHVGLDGVRRGRRLRVGAQVVVGGARHAGDLALR